MNRSVGVPGSRSIQKPIATKTEHPSSTRAHLPFRGRKTSRYSVCVVVSVHTSSRFPKSLGTRNPEYELVSPRQEVRRLTLIRTTGLDRVGRTDRHLNPLVP